MRKNYTIVTVIMKYLKTYTIFKLDTHRASEKVCRMTQPWRTSDRKTPYLSKYSHFSEYV